MCYSLAVVNVVKLPARLKAIVRHIEEGAAVADIGTDHGYLPVFLAQTGHARRIIASDVSPGSLETARRNARKYGVADKIGFVLARGLDGIMPQDADTIVVAGIGGENIISVLCQSPWTHDACASGRLKLILQPQTKLDVLRAFLHGSGYTVKTECLVTDRGREYTVLVC